MPNKKSSELILAEAKFEKLQSVHREQLEELLLKQAELMADIAELLTRQVKVDEDADS